MRTIKVTQNASGKFAPDTAVIIFSPSAECKTAADAACKLGEACQKAKSAISAIKFAEGEITESGANVSAVRRDSKTFYAASSRIKIVLGASDERVGAVMEAAEKSGLTWRTEYVLRDKSYRDKLAAEAVARAKATAQSIAESAGVKLAALVSVEYAASYGAEPRMLRAMAADMGGATALPEPVEAVESVTCEWEIQ